MKTYMPLDGLKWCRDSDSAHCDMPQNAVLGRPGGGVSISKLYNIFFYSATAMNWACA